MKNPVTMRARANSTAEVKAKVTRGQLSWNFFYVALAFALTIEGTAIQMVRPWKYPANLIIYVVVAICTVYAVLFNGWSQNKLILFKNWYESLSR